MVLVVTISRHADLLSMGTLQGDILQLAKSAELADEEVVRRVLDGETALFEILMRRYNPTALPRGASHSAGRC